MDWIKTERGYRLEGGPEDVELIRRGKRWRLLASVNGCFDLGRRASFDSAEKLLKTLWGL